MSEALTALVKHWPLALFIGNLVMAWLLLTARKHFAGRGEVAAVREEVAAARDSLGRLARETDSRLDALERDMAVSQNSIAALPTKDDLARLDSSVGKVSGEVQAVGARLQGVERNLHLLLRSQLEGSD